MKHTSSDVTRKQLAGVPSTEDRNESSGQGLYFEALSEATCSAMLRETAESLGLGGVRL
jgi:predicted kinase